MVGADVGWYNVVHEDVFPNETVPERQAEHVVPL